MYPTKSKRFLRIKEILERYSIGSTTWYRWVGMGYAPPSVELGPRFTVWREEDLEEFENGKKVWHEGGNVQQAEVLGQGA